MTKKFLGQLFRGAALVGGLAAAALIVLYSAFYGKAIDKEVVVYITPQSEYSAIIEQLQPSLRSNLHRTAFDFYAKRLNLEGRFRTGRYLFQEGESVIRAVRKLVLGEQSPVKLVVGEARTLPQLAGKLAKQIEADSATLLSAMRNKQLRKELGFVNDSTIAMFIPNTYEVWWDITPERLLHRIKREYDHFWNEERTAKLKRCGLSKYEVMTLASIVYEETKNVGEMSKIAGVYINRLRRGMPLQACPTAKYALGDFSIKRVLYKHTQVPSPYNTYLHRGLTPGPICTPSIAAIDAVLDYADHKYIYFCAKEDFSGRHNFATTLKEHNRHAKRYAEALRKAKIR